MKKGLNFWSVLLLGAAMTLGLQTAMGNRSVAATEATKQEIAFERVMKTQTLRCGYFVYAPAISKDPVTGKISGIMYDVIEDAAAQLGLKVEWTEEVTLATYIEGLKNNRYDAVCAAVWMMGPEIQHGEFTTPLFYSSINAWVRQDDKRFDNNHAKINDTSVTLTGIDGSYALVMGSKNFSQAKVLSAPSTAEYTTGLTNVMFGKADVTFVEKYVGSDYAASNQGKLRPLAGKALDLRPNVYMVNKGEFKLQSMLNNVLADLRVNGRIDATINQYEKYPGAFVRTSEVK